MSELIEIPPREFEEQAGREFIFFLRNDTSRQNGAVIELNKDGPLSYDVFLIPYGLVRVKIGKVYRYEEEWGNEYVWHMVTMRRSALIYTTLRDAVDSMIEEWIYGRVR